MSRRLLVHVAAVSLALAPGAVAAPPSDPAQTSVVDAGLPDLKALAGATTLTLVDQWGGLGNTYSFMARLSRSAADSRVQVTAVLLTARGVSARTLELEPAVVDAFLAEVGARKPVVERGDGRAMLSWTDDYPSGEVLIEIDAQAAPVRVFFPDQHRLWRVSRGPRSYLLGQSAADKSDPPKDGAERPQARLQAAWLALLAAMDERGWIDSAYGAKPTP
ncbi:MAG: hypothetical protein U1F43_33355 [Myxococcota bacterium]